MKYVGDILGVPVYSNPFCESGKVYVLNQKEFQLKVPKSLHGKFYLINPDNIEKVFDQVSLRYLNKEKK